MPIAAETPVWFDTAEDRIEPGAYDLVKHQKAQYPTIGGVLTSIEAILGVSVNQMSALMGMNRRHYYEWKQIDTKRGPGVGNCVRLMKLLILHSRGVPLNLARSIYWKEGIINWRNGKTSHANHLLERGWEIPPEASEAERGSTPALTQWGGQAGPQPKRGPRVRPVHGSAVPENPNNTIDLG